MKTAVQWLETILEGQKDKPFDFDEWSIAFEHAKAMEKEQMEDIYIGHNQYNDEYETFEEYYNETFKSE